MKSSMHSRFASHVIPAIISPPHVSSDPDQTQYRWCFLPCRLAVIRGKFNSLFNLPNLVFAVKLVSDQLQLASHFLPFLHRSRGNALEREV
ncbi:hypothetical protein T440DRAFT_471985 [Plenodomus tracheiphilus IPT5]|uniref:Uncharacterized protein n=1 Tax=Plenodomus tracheiphilus IPT5 TaxID=1408161 RepID=A0A6A7ASP8_9PLEO|nr:hypothetical protein T440DRAFT_471985 [Plenodomus tracheiphilus IPT5]